jgi:hypothetical protein
MDELEVAAAILEPHFDAVRDTFADFEPEPGVRLSVLRRTRFVIDPSVHDTPRHYGMCRDDGLLMKFAPEIVALDLEPLTAILSHEFGHAGDFAYPARWVTAKGKPAVWVGEGGSWHRDNQGNAQWREQQGKEAQRIRRWQNLWHDRSDDQVEWAADSIAFTVTGIRVRYCGPCMLQCFSGTGGRPEGLR